MCSYETLDFDFQFSQYRGDLLPCTQAEFNGIVDRMWFCGDC